MASITAFTHSRCSGFYDDAIGASECARPDLTSADVRRPNGTHRTERTWHRSRRSPSQRHSAPQWHRPSLLTTATACAAVLSSLALML